MKILLVEPFGRFIRLDRCMQSIDSWGGVFRFPLNLARIGAHLLSLDHEVRFVDMQAESDFLLDKLPSDFKPELCILSCGFPSMRHDSQTVRILKSLWPNVHVSTFGVVPTLLGESFFSSGTWGFEILFDSVITGGEPALGYEELIKNNLERKVIHAVSGKFKTINTAEGRKLFNHSLYRSPFTNGIQTYIEGSYGCPKRCSFCVVPELYEGRFAKREAIDIVKEFQFVIEQNGVSQISLWDEGTTFQRSQVMEICEGLMELRKSSNPNLRNFTWNTRSTTALLDEEVVSLLKRSGLSGITLGIESFDENVLASTGKGTTLEDNQRAIRLLKDAKIISIGHIVLGLPEETQDSAQRTIEGAITSGLDIAQFYCAVPYPGTPLYEQASEQDLIRVTDLTKYELCNPIMDTKELSFSEVGSLRRKAMQRFYDSNSRKAKYNIRMIQSPEFEDWMTR